MRHAPREPPPPSRGGGPAAAAAIAILFGAIMKDEIIDYVFNTPAVWDKRHKHHHNRHVLAKEWKKIASQMGAAEIEVRRCWKNLRQEFGKQLRKSDFQSGETSTDDIQWPYFTKLLFLQDQFPSRKPADANGTSATASGGSGIYADEQSASKNSDDVSDLDSDLYTTDDEVMPPDFLIQSSSTPPTLEQSGSRSNPPCLSPRPQRPLPIMPKPPPDNNPGKKRKLQQQQDQHPYMENHHHNHHRQMEPIDHRTDEDVGFFNSLLPHVRHLSPRDKFIFRMRVQQTLFELAFPSSAGQSNGGDVYPGYEYYKCETEMSD